MFMCLLLKHQRFFSVTILLSDLFVFLGKIFPSDGVKMSLTHKVKGFSLTHVSSFFSMSKTVDRVFQNLLVSLAVFARSFICVTNRKEKSAANNCCLYLRGFIEFPQNVGSLQVQL